MRFWSFMLFLVAALPGATLAQDKKIILTNDPEIVFTDAKGNVIVPPDEGGFVVQQAAPNGMTVKTWYGASIRLNRTDGILPDEAIADLTAKLKANPEDASLYKYRGIAWRFKGEYDIAIADFTESLRLNADQADVYTQRGYAHYRKAGKRKKAYQKLHQEYQEQEKKRQKLDEEQKKEKQKLDEEQKKEKQKLDGKKLLDKVLHWNQKKEKLDAKQEKAKMHFNMVRLHMEESFKTEKEKAIDDFDRALRIDEKSARTYYFRAKMRLEIWRTDEDLENAETKHRELKKKNDEAKTGYKKAKKELDEANRNRTKAKQEVEAAQTKLADLKKKLDNATKEDKAKAQKAFDDAKAELATRDEKLKTAETKRIDKKKISDAAMETSQKAAEEFCDMSVELIFARADLKDAIADFNQAVRLEPEAATQVKDKREEAEKLLALAANAKSEDCDDMIRITSKASAGKAKTPPAAQAPATPASPTKLELPEDGITVKLAEPITAKIELPKDGITVKLAEPTTAKIELPKDGIKTKLEEPIQVTVTHEASVTYRYFPVVVVILLLGIMIVLVFVVARLGGLATPTPTPTSTMRSGTETTSS
jgi:multidrug efflux pump subunit AcrA (membrane-fusion protein)